MLTYDEARAAIDPHTVMEYAGYRWDDLVLTGDDTWHHEVFRQLRAAIGEEEIVAAHAAVRSGSSRTEWLGEVNVLTQSSVIDLQFAAALKSDTSMSLVPEVRTVIYPRSSVKSVHILDTRERTELEARIQIVGDNWEMRIPTDARRYSADAPRFASQILRPSR